MSVDWVSYIEPPPTKDCRTEHVVKYLSRYLTGGPISDARIVAADDHEVTFLAREGTKSGGETKQVPVTLPIAEFVRRWSLHVLPRGYTKTRRYGGWSNTRCEAYLECCSILLETTSGELPAEATQFGPFRAEESAESSECECCPCCGGAMILQREVAKPSWRDVMESRYRPRCRSHGESCSPTPPSVRIEPTTQTSQQATKFNARSMRAPPVPV